jgi:hypothetical protein
VNISNNSSINWTNTPSNLTVDCAASILPANTGNASAATTCGNGAPTVNYSDAIMAGSCANNYTIIRTWTASDNCSNTITHSQTINVEDNIAPVITCPSSTSLSSSNGTNATLPNYISQALVSDNCSNNSGISVTQSPAPGSSQSIGNVSVTLTATDECGNSNSCTFNVNITNNSAINWTNTPNNLNIDCGASIQPSNTGYATATSSCGSGTVNVTHTDIDVLGSCVNSYSIIRTWTATDNCSNTISHTQTITITDDVAPNITCPTVENINSSNGINAVLPDYTNQAVVSDNCSNVSDISITQSPAPGSMQPVGNVNVLLTATDECGNENSCNMNLEIVSSVGITENETFTVSVYPNPFESNFTINLSQWNDYEITVRDALGRLVENIQFSGNTISMHNYSEYAAGTYYLKIGIQNKSEVQYFKILKK